MTIQNNEAVYDAEIAPLMTQIIAVCQTHGIPLVASFQLNAGDEDYDSALHCTTILLPPPDKEPDIELRYYQAARLLEPQRTWSMSMIISKPKD